MIEIPRDLQLIFCFVDCVQEVEQDHRHVDAFAIPHESRRTWGWMRITGADEDSVEGWLSVGGDEIGEEPPAGEGEELGGHCWWLGWRVLGS